MKKTYFARISIALLVWAGVSASAQTVNTWTGGERNADWADSYKWKLDHPPQNGEAAHFREDFNTVSVNRTVQLDNGIHLYGQELTLKGDGNINLMSSIPHQRTINIPASASGFANLTLMDNLSINGQIALSAKGFGTSASKGSITLKDRSTVSGGLVVGNEGVGSGQVIVQDKATFRITSIELNTKASEGGMAQIQILGGTVRINTDDNPFESFMADPSRTIVVGDGGTLRVESSLSLEEKKALIKKLIAGNHLVPASGCHLAVPILQEDMFIVRAEDDQFTTSPSDRQQLFAAIDSIDYSTTATGTSSDLNELVKALNESEKEKKLSSENNEASQASPKVAGFIVFFGSLLLAVRKPSQS